MFRTCRTFNFPGSLNQSHCEFGQLSFPGCFHQVYFLGSRTRSLEWFLKITEQRHVNVESIVTEIYLFFPALSSEQLIGGRNRIRNCTHTHVIVHRACNALIGQRGGMIMCARFGDRWVTICNICICNSAFISSILFRIVHVFNIRDIKKIILHSSLCHI